MFSKILIANRGEIANRVIRTAQRMGVQCVAVYSDADREARFVQEADEAWHLGGSTPEASYLNGDRIIEIALKSGAQAIHPGYGFLSENAEFAEKCEKNGLVFAGPPVAAIELMGSKSAAKFIMEEANVPLVPGYHGAQQDNDTLRHEAERIGYPLLIKASAGGGGKGMRIVTSPDQLEEALSSARREAASAFGSDKLLLEEYIQNPRHVEIQVFCDQHGNGVFLFERDCSVQRRHQKVIEEAPAPGLSERLRAAMGEAALNCARAIKYVGAGTVEFLLDQQDQFYFMEMNTRLQVEHPVTEMITGQDLVEWQLRVANGEPLPCAQNDLRIQGHAFEARIYAEAPEQDFLPNAGRIEYLHPPVENRHVRLDTGIQPGDEVGVYYDPMIAKLIVWDEDRTRAVNRMKKALADFAIAGLKTNIPFLHRVFSHPAFQEGMVTTSFIDQYRQALLPGHQQLPVDVQLMAVFAASQYSRAAPSASDTNSPWNDTGHWRLNLPAVSTVELHHDGQAYQYRVEHGNGWLKVWINETPYQINGSLEGDLLKLDLGDRIASARIHQNNELMTLFKEGSHFEFRRPVADRHQAHHSHSGGLTAPMNGRVIAVQAAAGDQVHKDQVLVIVEAMKMEHPIRAPYDGIVSEVFCLENDLVKADQELLAITPTVDKEE